jgi:membrane fusion protein, multidrug efflux system
MTAPPTAAERRIWVKMRAFATCALLGPLTLTDTGSMKKAGWIFLLLAAAVVAGGARYWLIDNQDDRAGRDAQGKPPVPVALAIAEVRDMPLLLEVVGRAEAFESVTLMSRVEGQVAAVEYAEGAHVRKGQVLVRLDQADFEAKLRQAEANLARNQAQLAKARADLTRYASLRDQDYVSAEQLGEVEAAAAAAEATVKAERAAVDLARIQLNYTVIRAPFAGVVGARLVFPGTAVKVNETPLLVVNRVQPLYVSFAVPEKYLARLRAALASPPLKVTVSVPGQASSRYEGEVRFLDNVVNTAAGTIQMKATLANKEERLTPGQFINVSLTLDILRDAVTIPAEAVQEGPEGTFVYTVKPDQSAEMRPVEVAATLQGRAAIARGLQAGETVVTEGQLRLSPGAKVKPKQPAGEIPAER